jgi:hypothetical protein
MAQKFDFSSPSEYSDWANYAGFNRKTGEIDSVPSGAIAPTDSLLTNPLNSISKTFDKISNIGSSLNSGNIQGAISAYKNRNNISSQPVPPTPTDMTGFQNPYQAPTFQVQQQNDPYAEPTFSYSMPKIH